MMGKNKVNLNIFRYKTGIHPNLYIEYISRELYFLLVYMNSFLRAHQLLRAFITWCRSFQNTLYSGVIVNRSDSFPNF